MDIPPFILASASPARRKLLQTVGIDPIVCPSDFNESRVKQAQPRELVLTLAKYKAATVARKYRDALILGCDSVLVVEGEIYGKPGSELEAIARWQKMRGKEGMLYTGHVIIDQRQGKELSRCGITKVSFAHISDEEIRAYVADEEPLRCAGCFALEGKGGLFVEYIEGCHSNIIGLSLPLLRILLADLGYKVTDFWDKMLSG